MIRILALTMLFGLINSAFGQIELKDDKIGIGTLNPQFDVHLKADTYRFQNDTGTDLMKINSAGSVALDQYGSGNQLANSDYVLGVGADGTLQENEYLHFTSNNIALGNGAVSTTNSIMLGTYAGFNASGNLLIGLGNHTLRESTGSHNIAIGYLSGRNNTAGAENVFIGNYSGRENTTGLRNTVVGHSAGNKNQTGTQNTYVGRFAGYQATFGNNTMLGFNAGRFTTTGRNNTFVGSSAGAYHLTGVNNVAIGINSGAVSGTSALSNTIALGSFSEPTRSSEITIGISTQFLNVKGYGSGLRLDGSSLVGVGQHTYLLGVQADGDIIEVDPAIYSSSLRSNTTKENSYIKNELSILKDYILELEKRLESIEVRQADELSQIELALENSEKEELPYLAQNIPNPTRDATIVKYFIPESATSATVRFFSLSGQILDEVNIDQTGQGEIKVDLEKMRSGNYMYALIINGELIDTKTMAIAK